MRINIRTLTFPLLLLAGLCSCSRSAHLPSQIGYNPVPAFSIPDSLLSRARIDFAFYEMKPAEFYEPELQVKDSFTHIEKCMVGIEDESLFDRRSEIILDLSEMADSTFSFPLPGARLLSSYGRRSGRQHTGMDLKINRRDTVRATFDGIVRMAGWCHGYGNVVVVRHYNGLETVYAHNSKHLVRSGDKIAAGTPLSLTGATGRASTDHLHFEIRINGKPIDPRLVIDFTSQSLHHKCLVFSPTPKGKIKIETV